MARDAIKAKTRRCKRAGVGATAAMVCLLCTMAGGAFAAAAGVPRPAPPGAMVGTRTSRVTGAPAAVKAFDACFTCTGGRPSEQWFDLAARDGFRLFMTDDVAWSSECSDGACDEPKRASSCRIDPAVITQIADALRSGMRVALYDRNMLCWHTALTGLPSSERDEIAFYVLDTEPGPSVAPTAADVAGIRSLGVPAVIYTWRSAWQQITGDTTSFSNLPLMDEMVPNWDVRTEPPNYPSLREITGFGGWSGYPQIEQQSTGVLHGQSVDFDSASARWVAGLR